MIRKLHSTNNACKAIFFGLGGRGGGKRGFRVVVVSIAFAFQRFITYNPRAYELQGEKCTQRRTKQTGAREQRLAKRAAADKAAGRARAGEDFGKLVLELSDDQESKTKNGEITFSRGSGTVPPQFEAAAFSLEQGKISDPVLTVFGYHVIKLLEKMPPGKIPLDKVHDRIVDYLQRDSVQKRVPEFVEQLKKEAQVEVVAVE